MCRRIQNVRVCHHLDGRELTMVRSFRTLEEELKKLLQLSNEWLIRKIADHEDEKTRIAEIFERVNDARIQFEVCFITF